MSPSGQSEIEERLKEALEQAKAEYESAKLERSRLQIYVADLGERHSPDELPTVPSDHCRSRNSW